MNQTFQGMQQALSQMTPEDIAEMRQMMQELNEMLEATRAARTELPGVHAPLGPFLRSGLNSLDDLMERMQQQMGAMRQLMQSMSGEQRGELEQLMQAAMQDGAAAADGAPRREPRRADAARAVAPGLPILRRRIVYARAGDAAHGPPRRVRRARAHAQDVRDWNDLAALDDDKIRDLLGEERRSSSSSSARLAQMLEEAGYIRKTRRGYELTPQGVRKIGEKALTDIFRAQKDRVGQHDLHRRRRRRPHRRHQALRVRRSVPARSSEDDHERGAARRSGVHPCSLRPDDFEVYRTEYTTRSATVLMVDMSRSMLYNGCFNAAKRVALALDSLIRGKYPRDHSRSSASRTWRRRSSRPICHD